MMMKVAITPQARKSTQFGAESMILGIEAIEAKHGNNSSGQYYANQGTSPYNVAVLSLSAARL